MLFISHDETLIENTANMVIHLEQLRRKSRSRCTVARMGYEEYLTSRNLNFSNQRRRAENDKREEKNRQEKLRRMLQRVDHDLNAVSRQDPHSGYLLKKKMHAVKSMEKRFERETKRNRPAYGRISGRSNTRQRKWNTPFAHCPAGRRPRCFC